MGLPSVSLFRIEVVDIVARSTKRYSYSRSKDVRVVRLLGGNWKSEEGLYRGRSGTPVVWYGLSYARPALNSLCGSAAYSFFA